MQLQVHFLPSGAVTLAMVITLVISCFRIWFVHAYKIRRRNAGSPSSVTRVGRSIANEAYSGLFGLLHFAALSSAAALWSLDVLSWGYLFPLQNVVLVLPVLMCALLFIMELPEPVRRTRKRTRHIISGYVDSGYSQECMDKEVMSLVTEINAGSASDSETSTYVLRSILDHGYEVGESGGLALDSIDPGLLDNYFRDRRRQPPRLLVTGLLVLSAAFLLLFFPWLTQQQGVLWPGVYYPSTAFQAAVFCILLSLYTAGFEVSRERPARVPPGIGVDYQEKRRFSLLSLRHPHEQRRLLRLSVQCPGSSG